MIRKNLIIVVLILLLSACGNSEVADPDSVIVSTPKNYVVTPTLIANTPTITPQEEPLPTPATSTATTVDLNQVQIDLELYAEGLSQPTGLVHAGDGSQRLFAVEKGGTLRIIQNGNVLSTPFLDITGQVNSQGNEQGLLGAAFHPDYVSNGYFYVHYSARDGSTTVSRFSVSNDPDIADPASEKVILSVSQPAGNHNGGHLLFGPDGYLYIGLGDGGRAGDVFGNGQNGQSLLGAMLRLDIDSGDPYGIPPDNPFINDSDTLDEIWAIGLRNPWRYQFDRLTGDLYIADVGQNIYEEVNFQPAASTGGENYGWPIMEGQHCYQSENCEQKGLILPVVEYSHEQGCSVSGGFVYRGEQFESLYGIYFFGDYCTGLVWGLARDLNGNWQVSQLTDSNLAISSFGEDADGELYIVDIGSGGVYHIVGK